MVISEIELAKNKMALVDAYFRQNTAKNGVWVSKVGIRLKFGLTKHQSTYCWELLKEKGYNIGNRNIRAPYIDSPDKGSLSGSTA